MMNKPSNQPQFLYLTTVGWKTGKKHRIEIWFVKHNEKYFVISERGKNAHWIRNINHNPKITFKIDGITFDGIARIVNRNNESELTARVSELMNEKYKWNQGLIVELKPLSFGNR